MTERLWTASERFRAMLCGLFGPLETEADFAAAVELYWDAREAHARVQAEVRLAHLAHGAWAADAARKEAER